MPDFPLVKLNNALDYWTYGPYQTVG